MRPDVERPAPPRAHAAAPRSAILRLHEVARDYGEGAGRVAALHDATLDVHRGDLVVVLGPSGSGKTTFLNVVGGLEHPTRGRLWCDGADVERMDARGLTRYRREKVGFVFQFFNLIPTLTAQENVEAAARLAPHPLPAADVLRAVGLEERLDHFPGQLSGGEQQRVAIARALVKRPVLLLCDEPTGELDEATGRRVLELLQRFNREQGVTVLLVTHNTTIARIADHVVTMHDGTIAHVTDNPQPVHAADLRW